MQYALELRTVRVVAQPVAHKSFAIMNYSKLVSWLTYVFIVYVLLRCTTAFAATTHRDAAIAALQRANNNVDEAASQLLGL
jgi:hypothetical protein